MSKILCDIHLMALHLWFNMRQPLYNLIIGEAGNAVSATSTVDYAKKAGISIGADAMTMFLTLMKEDASKMSLWARLLARVKK